jgi:hypothetical protein
VKALFSSFIDLSTADIAVFVFNNSSFKEAIYHVVVSAFHHKAAIATHASHNTQTIIEIIGDKRYNTDNNPQAQIYHISAFAAPDNLLYQVTSLDTHAYKLIIISLKKIVAGISFCHSICSWIFNSLSNIFNLLSVVPYLFAASSQSATFSM